MNLHVGYTFDAAHTSLLQRAQTTLKTVLEQTGTVYCNRFGTVFAAMSSGFASAKNVDFKLYTEHYSYYRQKTKFY